MHPSSIIIYQGEQVGTVTNIIVDMWYLDADWKSNDSPTAERFANLASRLAAKKVMEDFSKGIVALLKHDDAPSSNQNVLIMSLDSGKIFMRRISEDLARQIDKKFPLPWQVIDDSALYEKELKKEVRFFHPLKWKKVRAVAKRMDRDDIIFEVQSGLYQYAVVHLTWKKEYSRTFPITQLYIDWKEIYKKRIISDAEQWKEDSPEADT
ncbi:MAG: hypothetical protein QM802_22910 [Agriterribacter sp.]